MSEPKPQPDEMRDRPPVPPTPPDEAASAERTGEASAGAAEDVPEETGPPPAPEPVERSAEDAAGAPAPPQAEEPAEASAPAQAEEPAAERAPEPERTAADREGAAAPGAASTAFETPWGFIDEEGAVHIRGGERIGERVIGKIGGRTPEAVVAFYVERFAQLERRADRLEADAKSGRNLPRLARRIDRLIEEVSKADALGDFDRLLARLDALREQLRASQEQRLGRKREICEEAERLSGSTDWRKTGDRLKALQQEWRQLGGSSRDEEEQLWKRFRGALDVFFQRRDEDRAQRREQQERARATKIDLCEQAEALADSTDWIGAAEQHAALMAAWKAAGWAGRGEDEKLWLRFKAARQRFFERRRADRDQRRHALVENKKKKDALCHEVEQLAGSDDLDAACERVKALQAEWKTIGPVPRKESEAQWKRFRAACNAIFDRARKQRPKRRSAPSSRPRKEGGFGGQREHIERLRESIVRDQGHLDRWRKAMGGGADAPAGPLRDKIEEVERELEEKRGQLQRLEEELRAQRD